ncbi:MAG TPA: terminase small subunit [Caldilineaceae bacterium]|nr:terminase small subunit [Caldilineaceae bacterium]
MVRSAKQQVFVEEYLACWNAAEAARRAGYSAKTARQQGQRLLTNVDIAEAIRRRIAEKTMSADEVLVRLTAQGRADLGEYLSDDGEIDLAAMKRAGATHLLRKVKRTVRSGESASGGTWTEERVEVELYSAQVALELIGRHHRLFADKVEHELKMTPFSADEMAQAQHEMDAWKKLNSNEPESNG